VARPPLSQRRRRNRPTTRSSQLNAGELKPSPASRAPTPGTDRTGDPMGTTPTSDPSRRPARRPRARLCGGLLALVAGTAVLAPAAPSLAATRIVPAASGDVFTPGDVVVYRVGNGQSALGSGATPVFLDEYGPSGGSSPALTLAMPTAPRPQRRSTTTTPTSDRSRSSTGSSTRRPTPRKQARSVSRRSARERRRATGRRSRICPSRRLRASPSDTRCSPWAPAVPLTRCTPRTAGTSTSTAWSTAPGRRRGASRWHRVSRGSRPTTSMGP
jgi:hypothetical protein